MSARSYQAPTAQTIEHGVRAPMARLAPMPIAASQLRPPRTFASVAVVSAWLAGCGTAALTTLSDRARATTTATTRVDFFFITGFLLRLIFYCAGAPTQSCRSL